MNQVAVSPAKTLNDFMDKYKGQIALALPKHITADRMVRLAMTSFSQNPGLQKCDMHSIFASVIVAAQLGLEIGVGGQGYLVPYKGKANGQNMEMYARKVALLQVLKYMPKSVEVQRAVDVASVADTGKSFTFDGEVVTVKDIDDQGGAADNVDQETGEVMGGALPGCTDDEFKKNTPTWRKQIVDKKKTVAELTAMIQTRAVLTEEQKLTIDSWSHEAE